MASALLYETLITECYQKRVQVPEIFLINFPFTRGLSTHEGKEHKRIISEELNYCVNILVNNGVDLGILTCNTLHLYLRDIPHAPLSFQYLPQTVLEQAKKEGSCRLLVLGTENTCKSDLYDDSEIAMIYPDQQNQLLINQIIDRVLEGLILNEDAISISRLIQHMSHQVHFDGIVLGCTDLPVLHHHFPIVTEKPLYDSIKIPVKKILGEYI